MKAINQLHESLLEAMEAVLRRVVTDDHLRYLARRCGLEEQEIDLVYQELERIRDVGLRMDASLGFASTEAIVVSCTAHPRQLPAESSWGDYVDAMFIADVLHVLLAERILRSDRDYRPIEAMVALSFSAAKRGAMACLVASLTLRLCICNTIIRLVRGEDPDELTPLVMYAPLLQMVSGRMHAMISDEMAIDWIKLGGNHADADVRMYLRQVDGKWRQELFSLDQYRSWLR